MSIPITYVETIYCTLCDEYFLTQEARAAHVQRSKNHPQCEPCQRRFANKNSLRNHFVTSRKHHYCALCQCDFKTEAGFLVHLEHSPMHRDDSDSEDSDDEFESRPEGWEDALGARLYPHADDEFNAVEGPDDIIDPDSWSVDDQSDLEEDEEDYFEEAQYNAQREAQLKDREEKEKGKAKEAANPFADPVETKTTESGRSGVLVSCPLCLEAPQDTSVTRCGHVFCTSCIRTALSKKKMCPVCRDFTERKHLRKIYLPTVA